MARRIQARVGKEQFAPVIKGREAEALRYQDMSLVTIRTDVNSVVSHVAILAAAASANLMRSSVEGGGFVVFMCE